MHVQNISSLTTRFEPTTLAWVGDNIGSGAEVIIEALHANGTVYLSVAEAMSVIDKFDAEGRRRLITAMNPAGKPNPVVSGIFAAPVPA